MKYWNELDGSTLLNKIFSKPIKIGKIALFSLRIENDQPSINLGFDIPEFPDILPEKWKNKGYNTCRIGITCNEISNLKIHNLPTHEIFALEIKNDNTHFKLEAKSKSAIITFSAKFVSLNGPSVYINGPDDYYFGPKMKLKPSLPIIQGLLFTYSFENIRDEERELRIKSTNVNDSAELGKLFDTLTKPEFAEYKQEEREWHINTLKHFLSTDETFESVSYLFDTYFKDEITDKRNFMKVLLDRLIKYNEEIIERDQK